MIINRYITRQIFTTTVTLVSLLVVILIGSRIISFLGRVVEGKIDLSALMGLIGMALPILLPYLVPIGFFLALMIVFGRMYAESELTVLRSTGFSEWNLLGFLATPALMITLFVSVLTLWLAPWAETQTYVIESGQRNRADIDQVTPGVFYQTELDSIERVIFIEKRSSDKSRLENIFIAETDTQGDRAPSTLFAKSGYIDTREGERFLVLTDGYRQQGEPGSLSYQIIEFEQYQTQLPRAEGIRRIKKIRAMPTETLLKNYQTTFKQRVEFHWRLSFGFMCLVLMLTAIPLSRIPPRRSRYSRLLPAMLIYLLYLGVLIVLKQSSREGLPLYWGFYVVHVSFAAWGIWQIQRENKT
ncbi:MAG: LPS export ABC transporter permease LptF [Pseudomonadota bacterium]|nr:LPS export ABC transporter permease LptF [Pseudomonadota bacterium]